MRIPFLLVIILYPVLVFSQIEDTLTKADRDSIYIFEVQDKYEKDKVLHAEPLYIDLIRDLGARKGEREWNVGFGMTDKSNYDAYEALVEYEWAPIDRLGLEVELPFQLNFPLNNVNIDSIPSSRLESIKLAAQWSFLVNEKYATSMAIGYIHELEFSDFRNFGSPLIFGNVYNPFFVAAKRWGNNFHTLIYTGPAFFHAFNSQEINMRYEMHTNFHYMIPGTRNFIGLEVNKYFTPSETEITLRPQMRVAIADNFLIGIVPSIPIDRKEERLGMFLRLIWEPKDHHE
jgi:hypothetical protein